jgi:hypothetical protein
MEFGIKRYQGYSIEFELDEADLMSSGDFLSSRGYYEI